MNLFKYGKFVGASGEELDWKIECDALTKEDWYCIAAVSVASLLPFGNVVGLPTGGFQLAQAFREFKRPDSKHILVVDDVWTTGDSMVGFLNDMAIGPESSLTDVKCFVAFSRVHTLPYWVKAFMYVGI